MTCCLSVNLALSFDKSNTDAGTTQPGRGYVFVNEGQKHGVKEAGEMTRYGEIYSVTVFHQIHCLGMLRGNYWELLNRAFEQDDLVRRYSN